ncbi:MAG: hypothetical protein ABSE19_09200 [Candidatus Acidiferrum sp.]
MGNPCTHEASTPVAGVEGRFNCDLCGESYGTPAPEKKSSLAKTKKKTSGEGCKTMHLTEAEKADAAKRQPAEDAKTASTAAKAVVEALEKFNQLCKAADEAATAVDKFFSDRIVNDKKFRTDIETVTKFFQHHHPSHPPLVGKHGEYHRGTDWSEKELGKNYDYVCRKLREFHKAQFVLNVVNPPAPPEPPKPPKEKPKTAETPAITTTVAPPLPETPTPALLEDEKPSDKHLECKRRETALKHQLRTATDAAKKADDDLSEVCTLALQQREVLEKIVSLSKQYGNLIQPESLRLYLQELHRQLRAFDDNYGVITPDNNSKATAA